MIIVGVDGSATGLQAVSWAAEEAKLRSSPLQVVHVMPRWAHTMSVDAEHAEVGAWMRDGARTVLHDAVELVRKRTPEVRVHSELLGGDPRDLLPQAAEGAEMLVVGNHGLGGFRGLLLGSVALGVSGRSAVPVVVVRDGRGERRGPVVVGVDGSAAGETALGFAFEQAALYGVELHAVRAWRRQPFDPADPERTAEVEEKRVLAVSLTPWQERYPDVKVVGLVENAHPVDALLGASADAGLLVVGSRGRGELAGLFLGSVSHALLHHAECAVAVCR
ncbi:universal stress protein [Rhizohabitans arisaemae]|uniref:universal stress protein n=1 Tax=Rhizohabitans arisaemae TaxID=2720610 RepID=UPI0024B0DA34|nr:universal stress protein [Rhizohabitans arisaemae]